MEGPALESEFLAGDCETAASSPLFLRSDSDSCSKIALERDPWPDRGEGAIGLPCISISEGPPGLRADPTPSIDPDIIVSAVPMARAEVDRFCAPLICYFYSITEDSHTTVTLVIADN